MSKLKILNAIEHFMEKKQSHLDALESWVGTYPSMRIKLQNNIDTYNQIIKKLWSKYEAIRN